MSVFFFIWRAMGEAVSAPSVSSGDAADVVACMSHNRDD